jgi:MFS family permease
MNTLGRILVFGSVSGLLWSAAPGLLADLFSSPADIPATIIAGILSGVVMTAILATVVTRFGRGPTVIFGLLSLPLGAFVFGFSLSLITRFVPALTSGTREFIEPWTLGFNYALLSVISFFAMGLFPLALITTLMLRSFIIRGKKTDVA